jgi:hypothetical protein
MLKAIIAIFFVSTAIIGMQESQLIQNEKNKNKKMKIDNTENSNSTQNIENIKKELEHSGTKNIKLNHRTYQISIDNNVKKELSNENKIVSMQVDKEIEKILNSNWDQDVAGFIIKERSDRKEKEVYMSAYIDEEW